jgi:hypothetical protein
MSECLSRMAKLGEHRLAYTHSSDGADYYVCLNETCGEIIMQFVDCNGC